MKNLIVSGILTIPFLLLTQIADAQIYTYEDMPREVKEKMDLNKIEGVPSWNGILFTFRVTVEGLEPEEQRILMERASHITEIMSIKFEDDNHVIVECAGGTNFDKVKSIFSSLVSNITGVENTGSLKRKEEK